jgi:precorrin-4/cobalt-precorrin-4 C11-methyltransferase
LFPAFGGKQTLILGFLMQPVYIVGAGPGDPDLITVKGRNLLIKADVIVYANSLIPDAMLQYCRTDAEIIPTASKSLEEILEIIVDRVRSQKLVVRLHDGDPSLYGAIQEQIVALSEAEIPFEIIPGVSAFQLAAARLQVELTVPELVQTIILTRISGRTQVPEREELSSLAAHQASLCLYLSAHHVENAQSKLMEHYPPDTNVAICYRLGWEDEKILTVPLSDMASVTIKENLTRTTLFVISPALNKLKSDTKERSQLYSSHYNRLFKN